MELHLMSVDSKGSPYIHIGRMFYKQPGIFYVVNNHVVIKHSGDMNYV